MSGPLLPPDPIPMPLLSRGPKLLDGCKGADGAIDRERAEKLAKDFESLLLQKLMDSMRRTVDECGLLGDGTTQQIKSIFWSYLAEEVAGSGGVGLWKDIYRNVIAPQAGPRAASGLELDR